MEKPRILPPTLRERERYIVFEVISESPVDYNDLVKSVWFSFLSFLGELRTAESHIRLISNLYNSNSQQGVIKCRHDMTEYVRSALCFVKRVGEQSATIRVLGVTGTIKSAKNKYFGYTDLEKFE